MIDGNNRFFLSDMVTANHLLNNIGDYSAAGNIIRKWCGAIRTYTMDKDAPAGINWWVVNTDGPLFVFCGGVNDQGARELILEFWGNVRAIEDAAGYNFWAWAIARDAIGPTTNFNSFEGRQIIWVGQSGGAMVVEALYYQVFGNRPRPDDVWVLTGAPRGLCDGFSGSYPDVNVWRFMLTGDGFPSLPPRFREWPELVLAVAALQQPTRVADILLELKRPQPSIAFSVWPLWYHPGGGVQLSDDGYGYAQDVAVPPRATFPIGGPPIQSFNNLEGLPAHSLVSYVGAVKNWAILSSTLDKPEEPEAPGESGGGSWAPDIAFICPEDDFGNITNSPNGRVQTMGNILTTAPVPLPDGKTGGAIYLRGQLIATFETRSKARTAASKLNKFLARLPSASEVSTSGLSDGILQYLSEAAIGGGVDKRPVRVVT